MRSYVERIVRNAPPDNRIELIHDAASRVTG
jgi:hypothetical protein